MARGFAIFQLTTILKELARNADRVWHFEDVPKARQRLRRLHFFNLKQIFKSGSRIYRYGHQEMLRSGLLRSESSIEDL